MYHKMQQHEKLYIRHQYKTHTRVCSDVTIVSHLIWTTDCRKIAQIALFLTFSFLALSSFSAINWSLFNFFYLPFASLHMLPLQLCYNCFSPIYPLPFYLPLFSFCLLVSAGRVWG